MTAKPTKTRSVREASREAFRSAITEAAETVFARQGYAAAKMADIAAEAGVAAGTLYNYFASKEEVFQSIIQRGADQFGAVVVNARRIEDPLARIRHLMTETNDLLANHGATYLMYVQMKGGIEAQRLDRDDPWADLERTYVEEVSSALRSGQSLGLVRDDLDARDLALALNGIVDAQVIDWVKAGCPPRERVVNADLALAVFLDGARGK